MQHGDAFLLLCRQTCTLCITGTSSIAAAAVAADEEEQEPEGWNYSDTGLVWFDVLEGTGPSPVKGSNVRSDSYSTASRLLHSCCSDSFVILNLLKSWQQIIMHLSQQTIPRAIELLLHKSSIIDAQFHEG